MKKFPNYRQSESKDCGPTCIKIIAKFYGKVLSAQYLRELSETTREGSSLLGISTAAEAVGFRSLGLKISFDQLSECALPCVVHWNNNHFVIVYKIKKKGRLFGKNETQVYVSDPVGNLIIYDQKTFIERWIGQNSDKKTKDGIALLLEPSPTFYKRDENKEVQKFGFSFVTKYLLRYKKLIGQLFIGLFAGSLLQLLLPFLTQSVVDVGIKNQDVGFIFLVLIAQLFLSLGKATLEVIRGWIMLHLSTRINISLISDFFIKLMNLPISYFDARMTGDLVQRIGDHRRIEQVLTTSSLNTIFSTFNLIVFGLVLAYYNLYIFILFLVGSLLYFFWVIIFFKKRKILDHERFAQKSTEQSKIIELISGMQEIKLHNAERKMRWGWEYVQGHLFKVSARSLALEQTQSTGSSLINEIKNMLITMFSAKLVIDGDITLGVMLAISYIVGQLNAPILQLIGFMRNLQDAKTSMERLGEIHNMTDEEEAGSLLSQIPANEAINLNRITFRYKGGVAPVLENLSLNIPANKITAIVGASGSGKTTLMKLLLRFYDIDKGSISIGNSPINSYSHHSWRGRCGVVMQEGYVFNNTIAQNIAFGEDVLDKDKLSQAIHVANIGEFIDSLPLGLNTKIGMEGMNISTGQKQRLLIARAVYKNPEILFFDEATSSLDANNEKVIMKNLEEFFMNKTVVVIAHRLSTVKNAHQIVVLDKGKIAEIGNHQELTRLKGHYYELVKNQLELGS